MSETNEWYYLVGEEQIGPVAGEYLQQLAAEGTILPETQLWAEGLEEWIPAATVEGLFPAAPQRPKLVLGAAAQAAHPLAGEIVAPQTVPQAAPQTVPQAAAQVGYPTQAAAPVQQVPQAGYAPQQTAYAPQQAQPVGYPAQQVPGYPAQQAAPGYPAQPAPGYPMQAAVPGGDYPAPGSMKASFAWFIALPILPFVAVIVGFFMVMSRLKNLEESTTSASSAGMAQAILELGAFFFGSILLFATCSIIYTILKMMLFYRAWGSLQAGGARTTPGKAIGMLFIPFFNLYWMFVVYVGLAKDWNRIRVNHPNLAGAPSLNAGIALTYCITVVFYIVLALASPVIESEALLGILLLLTIGTIVITELVFLFGVCKLVNFMGRLHLPQTTLPSVGLRLY